MYNTYTVIFVAVALVAGIVLMRARYVELFKRLRLNSLRILPANDSSTHTADRLRIILEKIQLISLALAPSVTEVEIERNYLSVNVSLPCGLTRCLKLKLR